MAVGTYSMGGGRKEERVTGNGAITRKSLSRDKDMWRIVVIGEQKCADHVPWPPHIFPLWWIYRQLQATVES